MKTLLAALAAVSPFVLAAPAYAEPGVVEAASVEPGAAETPAFLASLREAGIAFTDPQQAVAAGQAVCGLAATGESSLEMLTDIRAANPALTINGAAQFATIAARSYCPQQLTPSGKSAK